MNRRSTTYAAATLFFLGAMTWMSVRAYNGMMGEIYYNPLKGFFSGFLRLGNKATEGEFRTRVAIFRSDATARYFGSKANYDSLVNDWVQVLRTLRISHGVIDTNGLTGGSLRAYNLLILPLAVCLSDREISTIKDFVSREGNGLILSGLAGARREDGVWRDLSLTAQIIGGDDIKEATPTGNIAYMVINGRSPLAANIPPGLRMSVNTYDRPISARIVEPRAETVGYWDENGMGLRGPAASPTASSLAGGSSGRASPWAARWTLPACISATPWSATCWLTRLPGPSSPRSSGPGAGRERSSSRRRRRISSRMWRWRRRCSRGRRSPALSSARRSRPGNSPRSSGRSIPTRISRSACAVRRRSGASRWRRRGRGCGAAGIFWRP